MTEKSPDAPTLGSPWTKRNAASAATEPANQTGHAEPERFETEWDEATPAANPASDALGNRRRRRIGDYILLDKIAQGGMGVVYRARQISLNRIVAVKLAHEGAAGSVADSNRFRFEAEAAARLDHPNIVPIYEVGEIDGRAFFSMAFVEGKSLADKIAIDPMAPRSAARLLATVADAVAYAHLQGVVHRDLKPANILLDERGLPRITDFGLAKIADVDSSLTRAGEVLGTPSYMAPEQAAGRNHEVGMLSDVYSLGATLYAAVTGRPPFQAATVLETLNQVLDHDPIPPRTLNPAIDRDLDTICLKCLAKKPEQRYGSAAAFADDLRRFLDGHSIVARPASPTEKVVRWCQRNALAATASFAAVGIFLIAFATISWSYLRVEEALRKEAVQRTEAQGREKSERWERYRSNLASAASALRLHNVNAAGPTLEAAPFEYRNWEWRHFRGQLDGARSHFFPHQNSLSQTALVPSAGLIVTYAEGESVRIWDPLQSRLVHSLSFAREPAPLVIDRDGKRIAYYSSEDEVTVRELATGKIASIMRGNLRALSGWTFSRDASRLATCTSDSTVRIWDVASGKQQLALRGHATPVGHLEFSDRDRWIVSAGSYDSTARIWDARNGQLLTTLNYPGAYVVEARLSPDGERVLLLPGYPLTDLQLFESRTGRLAARLSGHTNQITSIAFSGDSSQIATGSYDQNARIWDGRNGRPLSVLRGHNGRVLKVQFSPDGKRLISTSTDQTLRLWDTTTGENVAVLHGHHRAIRDAGFLQNGSTVVSVGLDNAIRVWDTEAVERNGRFVGHQNFVYDVAFFPDGTKAASIAWDGTARVWDIASGKALKTFRHPTLTPLLSLAVHPSGAIVATLGRDSALRLWDVATCRQILERPLATGTWKDSRLAFNQRGDRLAAGSQDQKVHLWDVSFQAASPSAPLKPTFQVDNERCFVGHTDVVHDVAFDPVGRWLASAGDDGDRTIRIWDIETGANLQTLHGHNDGVFCLAVSREGKLLASGSPDGTVRIWDTASWKSRAVVSLRTSVFGLSFNADGSRLASACADNTIRLVDLATFQEVAELHGHESYVHAVKFSPDGARLISASGDFTLKIWDAPSDAK